MQFTEKLRLLLNAQVSFPRWCLSIAENKRESSAQKGSEMGMTKGLAIMFVFLWSGEILSQSNVGIGTLAPNNTAILHLEATDKGLLVPRLSATERTAIINPANSLLVYDTDFECFYYYKSSVWQSLCNGIAGPQGPTGIQGPIGNTGPQGQQGASGVQGVAGQQGPTGNTGPQGPTGAGSSGATGPTGATGSADNAWQLTGNTGTVDGTNFIGTIDDIPLTFRVNNEKSGRIESNTGGLQNTSFGYRAMYNYTTGGGNTATGYQALYNLTGGGGNTAFGGSALFTTSSGNNNTGIGQGAVVPSAIGSNQVRIGSVGVTYAGIQVAWTITSDRNWKSGIKNTELGLEFIGKLRPVQYYRTNDVKKRTEYGFIAQEVEDLLKQFGATNTGVITVGDDGMYGLRYNDLIAPAIKAIQELKNENGELKMKYEELKKEMEELKKMIGK